MNFLYLFTSFQGRISRAKWWAGTSILLVVSRVIASIIAGFFPPPNGAILQTLVYLAMFPLVYAVAAKRFQDRDKPGVIALYGLIPGLVAVLLPFYGLHGSWQDPNALGWTCAIIEWTVDLWFIIELGFLKGTRGPNRFSGDRSDAVTTNRALDGSRIIGGRLAAQFAAAAGAVIIIALYNGIVWTTSLAACIPLLLLSKIIEKWAEPGFLFHAAVLLIASACALIGFPLATPLARFALRLWPVDPFGGWTVRKKLIVVFGILCLIPVVAFFSLTFVGLFNASSRFAKEYPSSQSAYVNAGESNYMSQLETMLQHAVVRFCWSSIVLGAFSIFCWAQLRASHNLGRPFVLFLRHFSGFADRSLVADIIKSMPEGIPLAFIASRSDQAKNWDPFVWAISGLRLLSPLKNLPIQIKTTDENWINTVQTLLQKAHCVVIDLSDRSPSVEIERRLIRKSVSQDSVVALVEHRRVTETVDQLFQSAIRYSPNYWNSAVPMLLKVGSVLAIWELNQGVWSWTVLLLLPFLIMPSVSRKQRGEIRSAILAAVTRNQEEYQVHPSIGVYKHGSKATYLLLRHAPLGPGGVASTTFGDFVQVSVEDMRTRGLDLIIGDLQEYSRRNLKNGSVLHGSTPEATKARKFLGNYDEVHISLVSKSTLSLGPVSVTGRTRDSGVVRKEDVLLIRLPCSNEAFFQRLLGAFEKCCYVENVQKATGPNRRLLIPFLALFQSNTFPQCPRIDQNGWRYVHSLKGLRMPTKYQPRSN